MTDQNDPQPSLDDAPTTPTSVTPPTGPELHQPTAWQPAGSATGAGPDSITWTPAGQLPPDVKRGGRGRWVVALLAVALVIVAAAGVAVFALGAKTNAAIGPSFLPASTPVYVEVRLDLPGTQHDNVVKLLSHFPGFADPSSFDQKIDDTFNKLVKNATSSAVSYTTDIKPWFGGQVAIGLLQLPPSMAGSLFSGSTSTTGQVQADATQTHAVVGISVKDRSHLDTLLTALRALGAGFTFSQEQYGDHTVVTVTRNGTAAAAYSVSDTLLLIAASTPDLKTSLDVLDGKAGSLAADAGFKSATKDLPTDRFGSVYIGPAAYAAAGASMGSMEGALGATGQAAAAVKCVMPAGSDSSNAHTVLSIVANGDNIALQASSTGTPAMSARTTTDLASHAPANALFYAEIPRVGGSLHDLIACLRTAMPDAFSTDSVKQVEKILGTKLEDYLSFVTDAGVSVTYDGTTFHWGIVAGVDNAATATTRVASLVSVAKLGASLGQAPLTVSDQQVGGATVTTVSLTAGAGLPANLPIDASLSVAVSDNHLYLGDGEFAAAAITRVAADSLGSSQRYSSALTAAGNPNGLIVYLDVDGIRQRIEAVMPANPSYTTDTQPYLKPFDRLIIGANQDAGTVTGRVLLFVK